HALRIRVERLAELHDIHAVLAERGANRRTRIRLTCRHLQPDVSLNFLRHLSLLVWVRTCVDYAIRTPRNRSVPRSSSRYVALARDSQPFSTCAKSSSTGVERPKIVTATTRRLFS